MKFAKGLTLLNALLSATFFAVAALSMLFGTSDSALQQTLDTPAFVLFWTYLIVTPVAAVSAWWLAASHRRLRLIILSLALVWLVVLVLVAVVPIY